MKNLKIFMFGILLVGMHLTSCKKDVDQQPQKSANQQQQQDAEAQNKEKLFEKSLTVYSADKTSSTTLRFRAASKELLDKMPDVEFTLVKTPEPDVKATDLVAPTIASDEGSSGFSSKNVSLLPTSVTEKQMIPEDAVQVDLPFEPKIGSISIDVKSKDQQVAAVAYYKFYYVSGYHRIKVTNFHIRPIIVDFYSYANGWKYSGYSYKLYQNTYAWYSNCSRTVGAGVTYPFYHNYKVNFYPSCL